MNHAVRLPERRGDKAPQPEFLNLGDAAKVLGISRPTLRRALDRGELPYLRIGQQFLIPRAALNPKLSAA